MTLAQLETYCSNTIAEHPDLKNEILDLYQLCLDEIEQGESKDNEIYLCQSSIEDLLNDKNK
jgi:hypothetical protein